jgi:hypothetical protein
MHLVVLLDFVIVNGYFFPKHCASLGHEVLGNDLRLLDDLPLLHLLLRPARPEDLIELVLLLHLKLLLLLLSLRQLLLEHPRHLLSHLRRNVRTHCVAVISGSLFVETELLRLLLVLYFGLLFPALLFGCLVLSLFRGFVI